VVIELARHQAIAGHAVGVITSSASQSKAGREALLRNWAGADIRLVEVPPGVSARRSAVHDAIASLRPDIVHLHCVWESLLRTAASAAGASGVPCVASTHGMLHPYAIAQKRWKKEAYLLAFRGHFRRISEHFALNSEEASYIQARFGWKSSVLYNGVELDRYGRTDASAFRALVPALGERPYALFVGRLHPIKGCDLLLRSFRVARDRGLSMDLVIAGPDGGALQELRALVEHLGLSGHVHFPGGIFGEAKYSALAGCEMFVHRPRFEGFGIAVIEAMASGRPVITTARCHLEEAAHAGALLCVQDNDESFAVGMTALESDASARSSLSVAGREWVHRTCHWKCITDTALICYQSARAAQ
jgi:glycosyltransferase involved in cell wall biosynthesis